MQKCATGDDYHDDDDDYDDDVDDDDADDDNAKWQQKLSLLFLIRAKELETVLKKEEQGMVVPITRSAKEQDYRQYCYHDDEQHCQYKAQGG